MLVFPLELNYQVRRFKRVVKDFIQLAIKKGTLHRLRKLWSFCREDITGRLLWSHAEEEKIVTAGTLEASPAPQPEQKEVCSIVGALEEEDPPQTAQERHEVLKNTQARKQTLATNNIGPELDADLEELIAKARELLTQQKKVQVAKNINERAMNEATKRKPDTLPKSPGQGTLVARTSAPSKGAGSQEKHFDCTEERQQTMYRQGARQPESSGVSGQ
ncbi:hypothetical protein NDU88_003017 [Pleurodeles waltl]|uniref:Uncharacterized protein n=1 Tax=Pleurodeles waltl TaxID=8319 RepID=A0AAV7Q7S4_PLEWA|nr:hypothetical protein NDU88_003017 [Pleurodeles waltl]